MPKRGSLAQESRVSAGVREVTVLLMLGFGTRLVYALSMLTLDAQHGVTLMQACMHAQERSRVVVSIEPLRGMHVKTGPSSCGASINNGCCVHILHQHEAWPRKWELSSAEQHTVYVGRCTYCIMEALHTRSAVQSKP